MCEPASHASRNASHASQGVSHASHASQGASHASHNMKNEKLKKQKKVSIRYLLPLLHLFTSPSAILIVFKPSFSRTEVYVRPHFSTAFFIAQVDFFIPAGIHYQKR